MLKLVTFVPATRAEEVRTALASAGCGCIGNYDSCSYNVEGEGMFRALESANPYCGKIGELHVEKETRIETILPTYRKAEVIKALLAAHPYEEPAFDLYPLQNSWQQAGAGVIGELETPETELEFLKRIKKTFEVGCLKHNRLTGREIQTVALCGGAGAFLMPLAVGACDAIGGNVMTDAFGVIAMVALLPTITIQILGLIYQIKIRRAEQASRQEDASGIIELDPVRQKIKKRLSSLREKSSHGGKHAPAPDYPDIIEFDNEGRW